jgi:polyhydroxyalkanoate synthesis repressor PhaR
MPSDEPATPAEKRIIKRYSNRKLYDTRDSRYVTLQQIGEMVRRGDDVQIIDNKTKEDKTEVTLALILSEDLKSKPRSVPLGMLRTLIQERGERLLSSLREGPIGRLIPKHEQEEAEREAARAQASDGVPSEPAESQAGEGGERAAAKTRLNELVESSRQTLDQLQATLDERVAAIVPGVGPIRELRAKVEALTRRLEAIEKHLGIHEPD